MKHSPFCCATALLLALAFVAETPVAASHLDTISGHFHSGPAAKTSPCWTSRLGWIQMWREPTSDVTIVEPDIGRGRRFTSSDFSFDSRPGLDWSLTGETGCGWGFDFRYLWVDDFTATNTFIPFDDPQISTTPPTDSLFDVGDLFVMDSRSELRSIEFLGRRCMGRFNVSAGFRYIELNETLRINVFDNPGNLFFEEAGFDAMNDLYGFQLGLDGPLWDKGGRFRLDGFTKFGVYYNDMYASAFLDDPADPLVSGTGAEASSYTTFGLEAGLMANYDVTCNLSVRGGYQLLYLDGVAMAADQVPNTGELFALPGTVPVTAHGGNSVLYHGLNLGLEYRF